MDDEQESKALTGEVLPHLLPVLRDEHGRWPLGQSGNPRGRPPVLASVRALASAYTVDALEALSEVALDAGAPPAARVAAARELLDRAHGRAVLGQSMPRGLAEMSGEELEDDDDASGLDDPPPGG